MYLRNLLSYIRFSDSAKVSLILQLFLFCAIVFFSSAIFLMAGYFLSILLLDVNPADYLLFPAVQETGAVTASLKLMQVAQEIGLFIIPPLLFAFLASHNPAGYLLLRQSPSVFSIVSGGIIMISLLPFINWLAGINSNIAFPDSMKSILDWMSAKEEDAQKIAELFLKAGNVSQLFQNIIIVALLPALGEELLFRGIVQRLLAKAMNIHFAVIITAILFSALHMQFLSFLPRFVLGVALGYMFFWSKNLWIPIFAHFTNNFFGVVSYYLIQNKLIPVSDTDVDTIGAASGQGWIALLSITISFALLFYFYKKEHSIKKISV